MAREKNVVFQERFDIQKWLDSEKKGVDTCGEYAFCVFCDKNKPTPCAKAHNKSRLKINRTDLTEKEKRALKKTAKKGAAKRPVRA